MKTDLATYLLKEVEYYKTAYHKSQEELLKLREGKSENSVLSGLDIDGVSRLLENPMIQAIAGPMIEKMVNTGGNLTGDQFDDVRGNQIVNYWNSLPEENKAILYEFVDQLAKNKPEYNLQRLKVIVNSHKVGSTSML